MRHKILIVLFLLLSTQGNAKNIQIVTTIKPLESLISNILEADDSVFSLVDRNNSPHNFALKPSHIMKIHKSDAVILINPDFETFMRSSFKIIPEKSTIITLSDTPDIALYPTMQYGNDDKSHNHNSTDYHIWLSPSNAIKIIHYITAQLSMINPEKKTIYQKNAHITTQKLSALDAELKTQLLPLQGKPFMVFHNAYQYFIKYYTLNLSGTITDNPAAYSSVKRIKKAQKQTQIRCRRTWYFGTHTLSKNQRVQYCKIRIQFCVIRIGRHEMECSHI